MKSISIQPKDKIPMPTKTLEGGSRADMFLYEPERLTIIDDPKHKLYDKRIERPLTEEFIESIIQKGVIDTIIVRKDGPAMVVTAGRRRVRGAIEANKRLVAKGVGAKRVPVRIRLEDDAAAFETNIITNAQRENDDVVTNAENATRYMNEWGKTYEEAAKIWGVGVQTIKNWVKVLDLAPVVRNAVRAGRLSASDAVKSLADIPRDSQLEALTRLEASAPKRANGKANNAAARQASPLSRLRTIYRTATAMKALGPKERAILEWVFGKITSGDLMKEHKALGEAIVIGTKKNA